MAVYNKLALCRSFAEAVTFNDEDDTESSLTKLQVYYELLSEEELYLDLVASFDILYPQEGRNTDAEIAAVIRSNEIPDKHAHLLGSMLEILPTHESPDIVLARCAELIGLYDEDNPNNTQEALFAVMSAHVSSRTPGAPKLPPRALN